MTDWNLTQWLIAAGIVAVALIVSVWAGGRITTFVLRRASHATDASNPDDGGSELAADLTGAGAVTVIEVPIEPPLGGGRWIGRIERFATTLAMLTGYPAAVAIIVGIKGLGRYPEIRKSSNASEKFVIGTLTSLVISSVIGALGRWALTSL